MGTINTSDFKKGLKVQLDGDPYLMIECNFVKPGKGQALYKCRLKHLIRGTTIDRTWKSGDSIESADVDEIAALNTSTARARSSSSWTTIATSSTN